jgi:hypothetical protein
VDWEVMLAFPTKTRQKYNFHLQCTKQKNNSSTKNCKVGLTHVFELGLEWLVVTNAAYCKELLWIRALLNGGRGKRSADDQHEHGPLLLRHQSS